MNLRLHNFDPGPAQLEAQRRDLLTSRVALDQLDSRLDLRSAPDPERMETILADLESTAVA